MPDTNARPAPAIRKWMLEHPARLGRACGFGRLTDDLHGNWLHDMLTGEDDMTLLAHRGSYKTTCLAMAIAELLVLDRSRNILFLRKTDKDVAEVLRQVASILSSRMFQGATLGMYGEPVRIARRTQDELHTSLFDSPRGAVQLLGQGITGSLTGKHADVIFTDDIVNLSDRISQKDRVMTRMIYQELQNIRNPGGRIINIGTPWHPDDAISLMPNVRRFDCYTTGLLSSRQLDRLRASMEPSLFAANYELRHIASSDALFSTPPVFAEDESLLRDGIAHVDAAYGGGDYTALTCGRRVGDTVYLYGRLWPGHVDDHRADMLRECERLMCAPLYLETNGDKGYLARELRGGPMPIRTYTESVSKAVKITTYLRKWWPNLVFLRSTDPAYIRQILNYTMRAEHDDAPDSAACLLRILDRRG